MKVIKENNKIIEIFPLDCDLEEFKRYFNKCLSKEKDHDFKFKNINAIDIIDISNEEYKNYCFENRYKETLKITAKTL